MHNIKDNSSESSSSSNPKILANPANGLKFGQKFKHPQVKISAAGRNDTESGFSSIDSKPSIKQAPKNSDFKYNPEALNRPMPKKETVERLRSFKYEKKPENSSSSSSGDLSSDSEKSSPPPADMKKNDPPMKVLHPVEIPITLHAQPKPYEPVLNHIPLNDKPQPSVNPEIQPARPTVPRLPLDKIAPTEKTSTAKPVKKEENNQRKPENVTTVKNPPIKQVDTRSITSKSSDSGSEESDSKNKELDGEKDHNEKKSIGSSSGFSGSSSSSIDQNDSLFKQDSSKRQNSSVNPNKHEPVVFIAPAGNASADSRRSQNIETDSVQNQMRMSDPSNKIMFSVKYLNYTQLFSYLQKFNQIDELFWDSSSFCETLCKCFVKDSSLTPYQLQDLLKLQRLCFQTYDNSDEFHRYLLYSYYCRVTSKNDPNLDNEGALLIGLSNANHKSNELSQTFTLASILHLIFLFERDIQVLQVFQSAKRHKAFTFLNLCKTLMNQSLNLLKRKRINQIFDHETNSVQAFFEFHSGFIHIWAELANTADFSASVREASTRAVSNPLLCRRILNKA